MLAICWSRVRILYQFDFLFLWKNFINALFGQMFKIFKCLSHDCNQIVVSFNQSDCKYCNVFHTTPTINLQLVKYVKYKCIIKPSLDVLSTVSSAEENVKTCGFNIIFKYNTFLTLKIYIFHFYKDQYELF